MPKLIFRGAFIRFVDLRYDEKSKTTYNKINFTAAWTEPIRDAMEWGEPPAGFSQSKLDGDVVATHFILTPNGRELKQYELQLDAKEASAFEVVRVQDGESTSYELRFQVVSAAPDAEALIGNYIRNIGKGEGQLRVNFEEQEEIPLEPDNQERLISEEQAEDTAEDDGPVLASATVMGGTHQKGTRSKRRSEPVN